MTRCSRSGAACSCARCASRDAAAFEGEGPGESLFELWEGEGDAPAGPPQLRDVIFWGYPASAGEGSTFLVARTLELHLRRRFASDQIDVVCAWHKQTFIDTLRGAAAGTIRQIHYVGHGYGGALSLGYHNRDAETARAATATALASSAAPDGIKLGQALRAESALMTGYFTHPLSNGVPDAAAIRTRLAAGAMMHIWGCFAGEPTHTFQADPYWSLFNAPPAHGIARHLALSLGIPVTGVHDVDNIHGMDFSYRNAKGVFPEIRPSDRIPQWLWPASSRARWITWAADGSSDESDINFLGKLTKASVLKQGSHPPDWFHGELPLSLAKSSRGSSPTCAANVASP